MTDHPIVARRRKQAGDFGLFEQLDIGDLAKQIAHGALEQTATGKQSAYSRERQRRSPTSGRHQRRVETEADARSASQIHQPVEPREQGLDFAPTAFDQGVKHSALRHPGSAGDTFGIFVALDHDYTIEEVR